ncbi:MAG: hypothetical protein HY865_11335 [Chloroflexi bacterium]|nr:hypothetical protein [Chloroflexota bacterium]
MNKKPNKAFYLNHIPVLALRAELLTFLDKGRMENSMVSRMKQALGRRAISNPQKTIERLNREELVRVIGKCPEIDRKKLVDLFEEYRYGTNPSFFIYLFKPEGVERKKAKDIQATLREKIADYNQSVPKKLPRVKKLEVEDLIVFQHQPKAEGETGDEKESKDGTMLEIIEGTYHFQKRVELIDDHENPISIYETVYGFFWINRDQGYVVIQAHDRSILHILDDAISEAAGLHMVSLTITKELKNALPFLLTGAVCCSSKLHDPNPGPDRFQQVSFTDDHLYDKDYNHWEQEYPEVSSARYKIKIKGIEKSRILTIGFDYGEMSLAGKLTASQFRDWALNRLSELIGKISDFAKEPSRYIKTRKFTTIRELSGYTAIQREVITNLLALLLDLKKKPGSGMLERSPLEIARDLRDLVHVQFRVVCRNEGCTLDGYLTCPICKGKFFHVLEDHGMWSLACANDREDNWSVLLPIETKCEQEHDLEISARDLEDWIEILPGRVLLDAISDVVRKYIPKVEFSGDVEYFMIHRHFMIYYEKPVKLSSLKSGTRTIIYKIQARDVINSIIAVGEGNQAILSAGQVAPPKRGKSRKQLSPSMPT